MENIITRFRRKKDMQDYIDENVHPIPQIAMLPMPEPTDEEKRLRVIADAHTYVEQIKQERLADAGTIKQLQAEVADLAHALKGEQRKSGLLELDIATALNNAQVLQTDLEEKDHCLSLLRQVLDKFGTKAPEKKPRKPRVKKTKKTKPQEDSA